MDLKDAQEIFTYSPETGELRWAKRLSGRTRIGEIAGNLNAYGYLRVRVAGISYAAHRIAWLLTYGEWPTQTIDHINGVRTDNRIENLREATPLEQQQNLKLRKDNSSGYTGVRRSRGERWQALIAIDGKRVCLGSFGSPEAAAEAYAKAKSELHTFNPVARAA